MAELEAAHPPISSDLIEAIKSLPHHREVRHCGRTFVVSQLDIYAKCPECGESLKLRSFSAAPELEDVFDAVLTWMLRDDSSELVRRRQQALRDDLEE
jgi:hypothetical protein